MKDFHCDFYIPSLDIFIEYQGFEGHGKEPFDPNKPEHMEILRIWVERAQKRPYDKKNKYLEYIRTWVSRDTQKRMLAKKNNLNYLEFFNLQQFEQWFNSLN